MHKKTIFSILCLYIVLIGVSCVSTDNQQEKTPSSQPAETQTVENEQVVLKQNTGLEKWGVIFDDDGSRDGMAALSYLLSTSEISIEAVSISYGEAHPEQYIQLVGQALEQIGVTGILLGAGQDAPLAGGTPFPDWLRTLGENFWGYELPKTEKEYPYTFAPDLFVEVIKNHPEPVTIFLSGTLTNLAQALEIDPGIKENIASVYFMGGAVYAPGNITNLISDSENKVSEWNIIADPQAAKDVFAAGLDMYMIPLDATNKVIHVQEEITPWHEGDEKAQFSADMYDIMFDDYGLDQVEIFDQTAAVIMVRPDFCEFEKLALDVVTQPGENQGQTTVIPDGDPNIYVCLDPDVNKVKEHLDAVYGGTQDQEHLQQISEIEPVTGTWKGSAHNDGFELQVIITINETCKLNEVCGEFDITNGNCSGTFIWIGMEENLFQFEAVDKTEGCGTGIDYLEPLSDEKVRYLSVGDYGETEGILEGVPR